MPHPIVALCLPLADQVHAATFHATMALDIDRPFHLVDRRGVSVEQARNDIVASILFDPALASVTHLLWIDDDMVFPPDALRRLLAHDLPIIGGLCHGRRAPHYAPILCYRQPGGILGYAYRHDYPVGPVEVDATGAAFILVKREVYQAIEEAFPKAGEGPYSDRGTGEDTAFCERAKECGFKVVVDTSLEIGHIAEVVIDSGTARKLRLAEFNPWSPPHARAEGAPVASVIIPTWNQDPALLQAAIDSALNQTVPVEVIVVDDGSDVPVELELKAPHRLIRIAHQGCYPAINVGIEAMTTGYFTWLSSDDTWRPEKIERQLRFMESTGAEASFHGYDIRMESGNLSPRAVVPYQWHSLAEQQHVLAAGCAINGLTVMVKRAVFSEVGRFDLEFPITADWEMWNRIGKHHLWHALPDILATRRGFGNASERFAADPVKRAAWALEDQRIRERYAPRCGKCDGYLKGAP